MVSRRKVVAESAGAFNEQFYGIEIFNGIAIRWNLQSTNGVAPFRLDIQCRPRRDQQLDARCGQQFDNEIDAIEKLFKIVQDEQCWACAQVIKKLNAGFVRTEKLDADGIGNGDGEECGVGDRLKRDKVHATRKIQRACGFQREARFADAARADQSQQIAVGIGQQSCNLNQFFGPTNEGCRLRWEVLLGHHRLLSDRSCTTLSQSNRITKSVCLYQLTIRANKKRVRAKVE